MSRPRSFDYDEARRLYAAGETQVALSERFGVSTKSIARAVNPKVAARLDRAAHAYVQSKRAPCLGGCGTLVWGHSPGRTGYCRTCLGLRRAASVRPDTLHCSCCGKWKSDDAFPRQAASKARRGRSWECRDCQTITRRARRHADPERERTYQREYKRRRRSASRSTA